MCVPCYQLCFRSGQLIFRKPYRTQPDKITKPFCFCCLLISAGGTIEHNGTDTFFYSLFFRFVNTAIFGLTARFPITSAHITVLLSVGFGLQRLRWPDLPSLPSHCRAECIWLEFFLNMDLLSQKFLHNGAPLHNNATFYLLSSP